MWVFKQNCKTTSQLLFSESLFQLLLLEIAASSVQHRAGDLIHLISWCLLLQKQMFEWEWAKEHQYYREKTIFLVMCYCFFFSLCLSLQSDWKLWVGEEIAAQISFLLVEFPFLFLEWLSVLHSVPPIAFLSAGGQKGVSVHRCTCACTRYTQTPAFILFTLQWESL